MVEENRKDQLRSTLDLHGVQKENQFLEDGMCPGFVSLPGSRACVTGSFLRRDLVDNPLHAFEKLVTESIDLGGKQ